MSDLLQIDIKQVRAAQNASRSLARLAILMRWAGEGVAGPPREEEEGRKQMWQLVDELGREG